MVSMDDGLDVQDLYSEGADSEERLLNTIDGVYATIVAQKYNMQARSPTPQDATTPRWTGSLTSAGNKRVSQNAVSTRLMQGLLAAMILCAVASMVLVRVREVLPCSPCSIAAVASLLANSSIVSEDSIPVGSEFSSANELRERGVLGGRYSLGWWRDGGSSWFGVDEGACGDTADNSGD